MNARQIYKNISASFYFICFQMMENSTDYNRKVALCFENYNFIYAYNSCGTKWNLRKKNCSLVTVYTRQTSLNKRNVFFFWLSLPFFFLVFIIPLYYFSNSMRTERFIAKFVQSWQANHEYVFSLLVQLQNFSLSIRERFSTI